MGQAKRRRELGLGPREEKITGSAVRGRRGWIPRIVTIPEGRFEVHADGSVYGGRPMRRIREGALMRKIEGRYRELYPPKAKAEPEAAAPTGGTDR